MRVEHLSDTVALYLGDCREILPTLDPVGCVVTDPPYGMAFRSNHRTVRHEAIANDNTADLLQWACEIPVTHSRYVFCRWDNLTEVPKPRSLVTWVKNNWSMGDLEHEHARQTEVALFYPGPLHRFPKGRPQDVIIAPRTGNDHHPTEKPVQLMRAVCEWTEGTILDPFMGAGSTGIAAVELGRAFVGIEVHEPYFDIARRRIEDAMRRPGLFVERQAAPKQEALL